MGQRPAGIYRHTEATVHPDSLAKLGLHRQHSRCIMLACVPGLRSWAVHTASLVLPCNSRVHRTFRYSDFLVNEIDASGRVVHLDNISAAQVSISLLISISLTICRSSPRMLSAHRIVAVPIQLYA